MASSTNKANVGQLTMITINIKGAKKKADLIMSLINTFKSDYILLQETNFKNKYKADKFISSLGLETTEGLPTSLHLPRTLKVEIKFRAGSTIHVDDRVIEIVTQAVTKINPDEILKVYNLGRPTEWYVTLKSQEVYTTLHMREFTANDYGITQVVFTHVDKPVLYGELHWVPPTFTEDTVTKIVENFVIPKHPDYC
jgi:hypothetical protein